MLRFCLRAGMVAIVGVFVLSLFSPDLVGQFLSYFVIAGLFAVLLKLALDIYLHFEKEKDDHEDDSILGEEDAKTYYDIEEYAREKRRRDQKKIL